MLNTELHKDTMRGLYYKKLHQNIRKQVLCQRRVHVHISTQCMGLDTVSIDLSNHNS